MKRVLTFICFMCAAPFCHAVAPEVNIQYGGILVDDPCVIPPGEEEIHLDFDGVVDKYLYANQRTPGKQIEIHLTECDLSLGESVKVTFEGVENTLLPGLLAIDGSSQATGIAIGMETTDGELLPLNKSTGRKLLTSGSNLLPFIVYIQGEPDAIKNKTITQGAFSATATFNLEYE
ncbi:type 1 fimbrial protein [Enterobacter sp. WCHEn045836]|uniref:fimbrial protein n=1 Tax=Enterobacter sp. WCHEn045836 TaxID=2497434 RepID=UPI000F82DC2C|nr:fimbrial protein [Enterobacter sp. WCHEn045836]RTP97280.1 type 1 fimbrial protein [Enterobacter sp. WCHEn045836]